MSSTLPPKEYFVIGAMIIFFGTFFLIWLAAKWWPKLEARQIERQQARYASYEDEEEETP
jgi:hypothetical protein